VGTSLFVGKRLFWKTAARSTFFWKMNFLERLGPGAVARSIIFFCLKNNFLESLGPGFFRGAVPGGDFFVGKRFFLESRSQAD